MFRSYPIRYLSIFVFLGSSLWSEVNKMFRQVYKKTVEDSFLLTLETSEPVCYYSFLPLKCLTLSVVQCDNLQVWLS